MPPEIALRDYQLASVDALRAGIRAGHRRQLLIAPTGAGKTVMATHLLSEADRKGSRCVMVVDRVALVDQTSATLDRYGLDHGVIQSGHWRRRGDRPIQVASVQTLERRGFSSDWQLVIVDEAHCLRHGLLEWMKRHNNVIVIGLTATPFTDGIGEVYTEAVNIVTTNQLIAEGHLVPLRMYASHSLDMTGAKIVAGEWSEKDIEARGTQIIGDVVSEWQKKTAQHFGGPAKTIVFSATVAHGDELCRQFQAAGFNFQQVSYKDGNDDARRALIEEFRRPNSEIVGLVSCEALTKGFDVPDVMVGVACRPYRKSFSSHVQQLGRVMRPAPGKEFGLWLDMCGNVMRFHADTHELWEHGVRGLEDSELDKRARTEPDEKQKSQLKCSACGFVLPPKVPACPACGAERRVRQALIEAMPGTMVEVAGARNARKPGEPAPWLADRESVWRQLVGMGLVRKKGDIPTAERFARGQFKSLYGDWPNGRAFDPERATQPSDLLERKVRANIIAWARAQDKARAA
jgi:DNA repair protein RadD